MLDNAVEQMGVPPVFRQPVAVGGHHPALAELKCCSVWMKAETQVSLPELMIPPIMVPTNHHDRHPATEPGQRSGNVKAASGYDRGISEPEVEEVAVHEQAVTQGGDGLEEFKQRRFDGRWRNAKVGVGDDYEGVAQHGAKARAPQRVPARGLLRAPAGRSVRLQSMRS
jgi:hypothetical protein